ncbi:MAG: carboxypeptidase-like regulatory domain-containing protein [Thermoplasmata archaeon]
MAAGLSLLRCPACGGLFRSAPPSAGPVPWVPCPHCSRPVALLGARDPPPLFRWEVVPGLYPVPRLPRRRRDPRRAIAAVLLVAALLAAGIAGALLVEGYDAARPLEVTVSGVVLRSTPLGNLPASGGRIVLTDDSGAERSLTLGAHGGFRFFAVPEGTIELNATLPGYAPQVLVTFVSTIYSAGPTTGLTFVLTTGGPGNTSTDVMSPFPNLAGFIASFGATAVLILVGAAVAAVAARHTYRDGRRPIGIAGGAAVLLVPIAILLTGIAQVMPLLWLASGPLAGLGAYVLAARLTEAARLGDPPEI